MEEVAVLEGKTISPERASLHLKKFLASRPEAQDPTALYTLKETEQETGTIEANTFVQLSFVQASIADAQNAIENDE